MKMTQQEVREMNDIQINIFKEFVNICSSLGLTYYMIHGSLLGAVKLQGFFPYDDDIDVAMPRKDYDKLIKNASDFFPEYLFLQSCATEDEYPLSFSKLRDSRTAFIQTIMDNFNINQGVYIDIFPIDNYPENSKEIKLKNLYFKLYQSRVNSRLNFDTKQPFIKKIVRMCSVVFCPSWKKAVTSLAYLYSSVPESSKVVITGGKVKDRGIPKEWFGEGTTFLFEGIEVKCPKEYKKYLKCIYGDYDNYNPAEKYINSDGTVTVSARIFSSSKSYKEYLS